ncbi:MAG TPA: OsmC family peroxiredoxin [Gemmatimonadaceae bacterium]|nr:OsmC family peroxiredoxin [Gemmatimonadaceae bacterium]
MPVRKSTAVWSGGLKDGKGSFKTESGLAGAYSFGSRFENATGSTPEELLAAAEASCFTMALSAALERNGTPATKVETIAACAIEKVADGFSITKMSLTVNASVPKVDKPTFERLVQETKVGCPVSRALKAVDLQVQATLA